MLKQLMVGSGWAGIRIRGQGLIEYALIILLVIIVVIASLSLLGVEVNQFFQNVLDSFPES